jgi:hypothetical protein
LIYNIYSINRISGIEFDQLGYWPDLRVRGLTNLKLSKFNQALKQSLVTMEKVFELLIWSIMARIAWFYFSIGNFSFSFLPNCSTISRVLYLIVFSSQCSFQRYRICGFSSHVTMGSIFCFETVGKSRYCNSATVVMRIFEFGPLHFDFLIGAFYLLIFLFLFYF